MLVSSPLSLYPPPHLQSTDDHEFLVTWIVTHGEHSEGNGCGTQTLREQREGGGGKRDGKRRQVRDGEGKEKGRRKKRRNKRRRGWGEKDGDWRQERERVIRERGRKGGRRGGGGRNQSHTWRVRDYKTEPPTCDTQASSSQNVRQLRGPGWQCAHTHPAHEDCLCFSPCRIQVTATLVKTGTQTLQEKLHTSSQIEDEDTTQL